MPRTQNFCVHLHALLALARGDLLRPPIFHDTHPRRASSSSSRLKDPYRPTARLTGPASILPRTNNLEREVSAPKIPTQRHCLVPLPLEACWILVRTCPCGCVAAAYTVVSLQTGLHAGRRPISGSMMAEAESKVGTVGGQEFGVCCAGAGPGGPHRGKVKGPSTRREGMARKGLGAEMKPSLQASQFYYVLKGTRPAADAVS